MVGTMASREEMSTSFGAAAATYEAGRPGYPAEAVEWMLQPARRAGHALRVADVGAGTGKLTRALVELGADVVAVDPDPAMLQNLRRNVVGVPTFVGSAEALPLPDSSLDAVVLGQAWHWVDADVASQEVARVLRPGGVLGLVWNIRDESVDWVRRLTEVMHGSHAEQLIAGGGPRVGAPFDGLESHVSDWSRPMTLAALADMMRSRSYIITASPDERTRIEGEFDALFAERDELLAGGAIDLPYRTHAYRVVRP
jgi:SAM-dependent methyltransferase